MELVHVSATCSDRDEVVRGANERTIVDFLDGDSVMLVASLRDELSSGVGVWLRVGEDYPAQLAARDVATLAHLVALRHVIVEAVSHVDHHAQVLVALLHGDEVNLSNDAATLRGAVNRPAPPAPITVWRKSSDTLVSGDVVLRRGSTTTHATLRRTPYR